MNYILFDDYSVRTQMLPLTFMRPVADIRVGILTIREKWERILEASVSVLTEPYLQKKFPILKASENILINSSYIPDAVLVEKIKNLKPDQALVTLNRIVAVCVTADQLDNLGKKDLNDSEEIIIEDELRMLNYPWDVFSMNDVEIKNDFKLITKGRKSQPLSKTNIVIGDGEIFLEEGAVVECAGLNTKAGPIYIGKDAEVMEGSHIRGPFALCEHAEIKMGAKIYGATTIGPWCKVGGEVNNSVFFGYSNKTHDGFIGHSVIAEWCNLGADTNVSNLKNTYDTIKMWSYADETFINTGLQFCGVIMADHSKTAINTQINTGTVVGVSANIFGAGFPRNFIPSFSWGGAAGFKSYDVDKAAIVAERVYKRRSKEFDKNDKEIMTAVFNRTSDYRGIS